MVFSAASWNVNSIKVRLAAVLDWLRAHQPDVLALQELKLKSEDFPAARLLEHGYHAAVLGQKTYNGVALLSRRPLSGLRSGLAGMPGDPQARLISGSLDGVRIINVYVPNGQDVGTDKYAYKLAWLEALHGELALRHAPGEPLLVLGDFNIAPQDRDVYDPELFRGQILFSDQEHAALGKLFDWGLEDVFRRFQDGPGHYTWWDYRMNAFRRHQGARIDLILATRPLGEAATSCIIDREPRRAEKPSDHAPVLAAFDLPLR